MKTFEHLRKRELPFWMISHPEGTRWSKAKLKKSHEWAKKQGLPILNNVLLPRSKGFIATVRGLRGISVLEKELN